MADYEFYFALPYLGMIVLSFLIGAWVYYKKKSEKRSRAIAHKNRAITRSVLPVSTDRRPSPSVTQPPSIPHLNPEYECAYIERQRLVDLIERKCPRCMEEAYHGIYRACEKYRDTPYQLHFLLVACIRVVYPLHTWDEGMLILTVELCDLDLALFGSQAKDVNGPALRKTAERKAIVLEKLGRADECAQVCRWALSHACDGDEYWTDRFAKRMARMEREISNPRQNAL